MTVSDEDHLRRWNLRYLLLTFGRYGGTVSKARAIDPALSASTGEYLHE